MVAECKPEWNREAIMVFSRLPSLRRLQATPLLQTSLIREPKNEELDSVAEVKLSAKLSLAFWVSTFSIATGKTLTKNCVSKQSFLVLILTAP